MGRMKSIFSKIAIAVSAAVLLAVPASVHADGEMLFPGGVPEQVNGTTLDGKWNYYDYGDGTLSVIAKDKTMVTAEVPETINGMPVNMIEVDCFKDMKMLESVTIPSTVTIIEDFAFYNCTSLKSVTLPTGLETLSWQAFYNCTSLEEVTIPSTVTSIEEFVFEGCSNLKAIHVSDGNKNYKDVDGVLFDQAGSMLIRYPCQKTDTVYDIPEGCTVIEDWAFVGNTYIEEVDLTGVTEIGEDAFYYCTALKSVTLPEGLTELKNSVFAYCTALSDINIPESLTTIGKYTFLSCASMEKITLTKNVTSIGEYALGFYYSDQERLERIPEFVIDTTNDTQAFAYALENDIKSTGGVTQSSVFIYIIIGVMILVLVAAIVIILVQRRIQKRYELR